VVPGELWFDTSKYSLNAYNLGWNDVSCLPYASLQEYNNFVTQLNGLTSSTSPKLATLSTRPTPADWTTLINATNALANQNNLSSVNSSWRLLAADNFASCNASSYGPATATLVLKQMQTAIDTVSVVKYPPTLIPLAGFSMATVGVVPFTVNFTNTSTQTFVALDSNQPNGYHDTFGPTRFLWNFGDGTTLGSLDTYVAAAAGNPSHIYTAQGAYTITLTVKMLLALQRHKAH